MKTSLPREALQAVYTSLHEANSEFTKIYPGESAARQPVHTVYGGGHLFKADTAQKLGAIALRALQEYAPNFVAFARALHWRGAEHLPHDAADIATLQARLAANDATARTERPHAWLAHTIYARVVEKLQREPVEDFRLDFEDGYGNRVDAEEDSHAEAAAIEVAQGMQAGTLPPFIGIRIKPFTEELKARSIRTMDIFLSTLLERTSKKLPNNFVVTLPKVTIPEQVAGLVQLFEVLEDKLGLPHHTLKLEIMIETPQSIINANGACAMPSFVAAAQSRCVAAHFGVYDYTASSNVSAPYQSLDHPSCDFARHMMTVALMGTGVWLADGATNVMPVGPHRGASLTEVQMQENTRVVHDVWKLCYDHVQHSLKHGFYQGWDLHPAQLPIRYAAVYHFFLEGLEASSTRLKNFIDKAAQATLVGAVFDDAATGQGLLNFFLRGINCGAIKEEEALATGLTLTEIRGKSFVKILNTRRNLQ